MKLIAWYLPQYHSFLENETFWGKDFTEWTNLKAGKILGDWHELRYPHPDIGYYCLLDKDIRKLQAEIAKKYGVYGFCYYHYWFGDKLVMHRPLELMLQDGEPDLPFCFSWANESWRAWMWGGAGKLLIPQKYGDEQEWLNHLNYLLQYFKHPNYICIDNQPVLLIYAIHKVENLHARLAFWKKEIIKHGFDGIFIVSTMHSENPRIPSVADAAVEFFPNWNTLPHAIPQKEGVLNARILRDGEQIHYIHKIDRAYDFITSSPVSYKRVFRGLMSGFDSSPRSPTVTNIFEGASPEKYKKALCRQIKRSTEEFLFINAWNEWGEQASLEPDDKYGYAYLEATHSALRISQGFML